MSKKTPTEPIEPAPEVTEALKAPLIPTMEEVEGMSRDELDKIFMDKHGTRAPDFSIGLTQEGVAAAFAWALHESGLLGPDTIIEGMITPIKFEGEGATLPIGVYVKTNSQGMN